MPRQVDGEAKRAGKRVYGPVPSRRLGLSLGVDLVPHKVCPYDCSYCQLGPTTELCAKRRDFYPPSEVLEDVRQALQTGPRPDVLTLAGSGEPTLYRSLTRLIEGLRALAPRIPVALITNSALLYDPEVEAAARSVDILVPSLDAGDEDTWVRINHPATGLTWSKMMAGLRAATRGHPGSVRVEVMLLGGVNDSDASLQAIAAALDSLDHERVELNTPVRPVPKRGVRLPTRERLDAALSLIGPKAQLIGRYRGAHAQERSGADAEARVREYLARRPATLLDLAASLGLPRDAVLDVLREGRDSGLVLLEGSPEEGFYRLNPDRPNMP